MRKPNTATLVILLCVTLGFVQAQQKKPKPAQTRPPCANAQTQMDLNSCFCNEYKKADTELNRVYQQVLAANKDDAARTEKLKVAQRAWIAFRDAQMEAFYPTTEDPRLTYGSVYQMCYCQAEQGLTEDRTKQLKRMLSSKEGDVCE